MEREKKIPGAVFGFVMATVCLVATEFSPFGDGVCGFAV